MLGLCPLPEREMQTQTPSPNINSPPRADAELCTCGTGKTSCLSLQGYYRFKFRISVLFLGLVCLFLIAKVWLVSNMFYIRFFCVFQFILIDAI